MTGSDMRASKACAKCGKQHQRRRSTGKFESYCLECHAAYMRKNRKPLTWAQAKRASARALARIEEQRGRIERKPCEVCGAHAERHHDDYDKPKEVRWLCREHHMEWHQKFRAVGTPTRFERMRSVDALLTAAMAGVVQSRPVDQEA